VWRKGGEKVMCGRRRSGTESHNLTLLMIVVTQKSEQLHKSKASFLFLCLFPSTTLLWSIPTLFNTLSTFACLSTLSTREIKGNEKSHHSPRTKTEQGCGNGFIKTRRRNLFIHFLICVLSLSKEFHFAAKFDTKLPEDPLSAFLVRSLPALAQFKKVRSFPIWRRNQGK